MNELDRRRSSIGLLAVFMVTILTVWCRNGSDLVDLTLPHRQRIQFHVDINRAARDELLLLPGVGPTIAQRIISCRKAEGQFRCIDELQRVHGIGPKTVERLRPYLQFENRADSR